MFSGNLAGYVYAACIYNYSTNIKMCSNIVIYLLLEEQCTCAYEGASPRGPCNMFSVLHGPRNILAQTALPGKNTLSECTVLRTSWQWMRVCALGVAQPRAPRWGPLSCTAGSPPSSLGWFVSDRSREKSSNSQNSWWHLK